jgi:hypothetical protein
MTVMNQFSGHSPGGHRGLLGIRFHQKIRTGEKHLPWSAVFMLSMMWFTWGFNIFAGGVALTFTIQKFNKNPQIISLVMTGATLLMLGPVISYVSDQLWTRAGRRRPFLIIAWIGGCISMICFAALPQISGALNHLLISFGLAPVGPLIILAVMIACYKKMWDGAAPLEPLFLECVPPDQRGRFWAIRGMLFTLAVTMFYQILWPVYDRNIDIFAWLGRQGKLYLTGEQLIYIMAGGLFFFTGLFVIFCVEEVHLADAPNKSVRELLLGKRRAVDGSAGAEIAIQSDLAAHHGSSLRPREPRGVLRLPLVGFVLSFAKDVFLKPQNIPFYIVLIIPGIESMVWGNFGQLMQNDQFHYSKQAQADWAFPMQIMTFLVLTPFAGWYSDVRCNVRWWLRVALLILSGVSFCVMIWVLKRFSPSDIHIVPSFFVLSLVTALTALSMGTFYVPVVETMLDYVGREHARAWVALLTVVKSMITTGLLYIVILHSVGRVPPIMVWMVFAVVGATLGALMDTFIGPMIYDYMPRSQMGTINSGKGMIELLTSFGAANMGAWWIVFFSNHVHLATGTKYDYTSMYILQFMLFIPAILAKFYFIRLVTKGKITKCGVQELQQSPADGTSASPEIPTDVAIEEQLVHATGAR